jgi:ParB family transcriptional regulator, chromosome partitioning protein
MDHKTNTPVVLIPLKNLIASERNVRKTGGESIDDIAASILKHGLIQNLTVIAEIHPKTKAETGKFEVVVGGRRLAAIQKLSKQKKLPKSLGQGVPCQVVDSAKAVEVSLAENTLRLAMHPADQFVAFSELVKGGQAVEEVAASFGVSARFVRQRLKLSNVAPRFIEAYRLGEAHLDQLEALAICDDHAEQERVWDNADRYSRSAHQLRHFLTQQKVRSSDRRVKFIGIERYLAAGGTIDQDLFDEAEEGYLNNSALVDKLVHERADEITAKLKAEGWSWAEPALDSDYWKRLNSFDRLQPVPVEMDKKSAQEEAALHAELDTLTGKEEFSDEEQEREAAINARLEELESANSEFTTEQKERSGVLFVLGYDGELTFHCGLVERASKASGNDDENSAETQDKGSAQDLSGALLVDLTRQRTVAIWAELASRPDVALVAITHHLAAHSLYELHGEAPSALLLRTSEFLDLRGTEESKAMVRLEELEDIIGGQLPPIAELWDWLCKQPQDKILQLLAVALARSVTAVQLPTDRADCGKLKGAQALAAALGLDMADWWTPDSDNYLARVKREQIIAAIEEATGAPADAAFQTLKKKELVEKAETLLAGKRWVPQALR